MFSTILGTIGVQLKDTWTDQSKDIYLAPTMTIG